MKSIIPYIVIFIIGTVAGMCLCRSFFPREKVEIQRDTTVRYVTKYYSKPALANRTYRIDIPEVGSKEYVFLTDTTTLYRDSVRYLAAPREYYYTNVEDAEIWHSGIDSRIDSLKVRQKITDVSTIVEKIEKPRLVSFQLDLGCDVGKNRHTYIAPSLGASVGLKRWALVGEIGCNLDVIESNVLEPSLYYQIGLRYSLIKR